jgi:hypothetical protein
MACVTHTPMTQGWLMACCVAGPAGLLVSRQTAGSIQRQRVKARAEGRYRTSDSPVSLSASECSCGGGQDVLTLLREDSLWEGGWVMRTHKHSRRQHLCWSIWSVGDKACCFFG